MGSVLTYTEAEAVLVPDLFKEGNHKEYLGKIHVKGSKHSPAIDITITGEARAVVNRHIQMIYKELQNLDKQEIYQKFDIAKAATNKLFTNKKINKLFKQCLARQKEEIHAKSTLIDTIKMTEGPFSDAKLFEAVCRLDQMMQKTQFIDSDGLKAAGIFYERIRDRPEDIEAFIEKWKDEEPQLRSKIKAILLTGATYFKHLQQLESQVATHDQNEGSFVLKFSASQAFLDLSKKAHSIEEILKAALKNLEKILQDRL